MNSISLQYINQVTLMTMKNINLYRINNERFSVRFCAVAKDNGIKTVGKMKQLLSADNNDSIDFKGRKIKKERLFNEINEL